MQWAASSFTQPQMPSGRRCNKLGGLHRLCTNTRPLCRLTRPTATLWSSWRLGHLPCIRCMDNIKNKRAVKSDIITRTKPNPNSCPSTSCSLILEAENLNCGKAVIFKLDILVISEGSNSVQKLMSIRMFLSCFTKVSLLCLQIRCCRAADETARFMHEHLG